MSGVGDFLADEALASFKEAYNNQDVSTLQDELA